MKKCVHDAVARHAVADLAVTAPTTEGDPITSHYRVTGGETLAVYTDASKDAFGSGTWTLEHISCTHTDDHVSEQVCSARGMR